MNEDFAAVLLFAHEMDAHGGERRRRAFGLRKPDIRRVALAKNVGGAFGAIGHSAAKHDNGVSVREPIFANEPSSDVAKREDARNNDRKNSCDENCAVRGKDGP